MSDRFRLSPVSAPFPHRRLDLAAGTLLIAGFLVAVCLFSHDPADPPASGVYPPNDRPANLLGSAGAHLSHALSASLGLGAYTLLAAWFVLVVLLFLRRGLVTWSLRLLGWLLLVPVTSLFVALASADAHQVLFGWTPVTGPGGSIGAWLAWWLRTNLAPTVQALALSGLVLAVLVLIADFLLARLARVAWSACHFIYRRGWQNADDPLDDPRPRRPIRRPVPVRTIAPIRPRTDIADAMDKPASTAVQATASRAIPIRYHDRLDAVAPAGAIRPSAGESGGDFDDYELPALSLLEDPEPNAYAEQDHVLRERANLLEKTFADFGLKVQVVGINTGPVITQYEIALDTGLRVQKVTRLADDIALNLRVPNVRVVAPIPGKNTVGIEMPNEERARVRLKEVLLAAGKKIEQYRIPLLLGKDAEGGPLVAELADMPHLLIAGRTGTGKSVCMNAIILSILLTRRPDQVRMIMIDPKQTEMSDYNNIPHLMHPVVTDMKKAEAILAWAVDKMEERYDLLRRARVRSTASYNELSYDEILRRVQPEDDSDRSNIPERMPSIVIFVDEMADLILMMRKEVEGHIIRLAQKSRAAGIHLVVATQKPTVDVITGLIKSNLPARICFKVVNKSDSRVVLDEMGAEKLLGKGDMLFQPAGGSSLVRGQCTYASDHEIARVVEVLETDEPCYAEELMSLSVAGRSGTNLLESLKERDDLYEAAAEIVVREQRGSVSLLQRSLGIGYGRAARLIDFMAEDGIVGSYNGSNAREVLYSLEQWEELKATASQED